ncbi:MAG TPA: hypothetical protein VGL93_27940 [Streptosporangiaceae bacterium]
MTSTGDYRDLLTHSPDGESRGHLARVGDVFPLDPSGDLAGGVDEPRSARRPWGLRYLTAPPAPRAGRHDADTGEYSTGPNTDNRGPEEKGKD